MAGAARAVSVSFLEHGIAVLRMQRGENRINKEFIDTFHSCLDEVESNKNCKGLITTSEGKFFSNGLDLQWLSQQSGPESFQQFITSFNEMLGRLLTFPLPTAAAINGHCFAGGAMVAFSHDLRVMNSEKGWICYNEVFLNLRLAPFVMKVMQLKANPKTFHNMMVFGQRFTGPEAESAGLIDKAIPSSLVENESQKLLQAWLGKDGIQRESLHNMKKDVYADALKELYTLRPSKV
ncbi:uncharacterized protein [Littorina saxatilis]|uniref:Uncharacterized protein n=1 Tax=Littorina saxatilis TaxID=31220 RepID=A0AAN9BZN4_9CAEN